MAAFANSATVLVVDECEMICELIELLLVRVGYVVETATNGETAMAIAGVLPEIHVLICSADLPDISGPQLAFAIKEHHPSLSTIFAHASYLPNHEPDVSGVLQKPFSIIELRRAVSTALNAAATSPEPTLTAAQ